MAFHDCDHGIHRRLVCESSSGDCVPVRASKRLSAALHIELAVDVVDMSFDGADRNDQRIIVNRKWARCSARSLTARRSSEFAGYCR